MKFQELFDLLDVEKRGEITGRNLSTAARRLGWGWREAPVFAVLHFFTRFGPVSPERFDGLMNQMAEDPMGPYGKVLLNAPWFSEDPLKFSGSSIAPAHKENGDAGEGPDRNPESDFDGTEITSAVEVAAGKRAAEEYAKVLDALETARLSPGDCALLIVDPQRSFTQGAWMRSIGKSGRNDVRPIGAAFENCARVLGSTGRQIETMLSRCPFPPDSYDWEEDVKKAVGESRPYFVKPGNSILFPPSNGFSRWIEACVLHGKNTLVLGGCTLNSCVRVSAVETKNYFARENLEVLVDLSISGARAGNYIKRAMFGGKSSVEFAVEQMSASGVKVARNIRWKKSGA